MCHAMRRYNFKIFEKEIHLTVYNAEKMKLSVSFLFAVCFVGQISLFAQKILIKDNDKSISAKIDTFILKKMQTLHIPGLSLAVMSNGEIIYAKGYGFSNLEHKVAATEITVYQIASITKTFTATAIMMLMEKGRLSLIDPVSKYVADLPSHWQSLTITQLLSHTSGIKTNSDAATACKFDADLDNYNLRDRLKEDTCLPLQFSPGDKFLYSGTNYLLLGMVIENVTGMTFEKFLKERIFDPLEMKATGMLNHNILIPNRAAGYRWKKDQFFNLPPEPPALLFSDGGIVSTVTDMAKWDAAFYTDKLMQTETLQKMFEPIKLKEGMSPYGLGFGLTPYRGHRRVGHLGANPGFQSAFSRFIDDKISIILFINSDEVSRGEIANQVAAFYFEK